MRAKILVVEDNFALRDQIEATLEFNDYEVIVASDGLEGLEKARNEAPQLVLSDLMMPGGSGLDMVRQIRSNPEIAGIPIVLISARVSASDVREGMNLGADDYLTKPFRLEELLRAVESRLIRHRATVAHLDHLRVVECSRLLHSLPSEAHPPIDEIVAMSAYLRNRLDSEVCLPDYSIEIISAIGRAGVKLRKLAENLVLHFQLNLAERDSSMALVFDAAQKSAAMDLIRTAAGEVASSYCRSPDLLCTMREEFVIAMAHDHFRRAITEIVDNAFKFSSAGTVVEIRADQRDGFVVLTVMDRGIGMTEHECEHMEPFCKWKHGTERPTGLGLGFSNARRLLGFAGGSLSIRTGSGGGCIATLRVPTATTFHDREIHENKAD